VTEQDMKDLASVYPFPEGEDERPSLWARRGQGWTRLMGFNDPYDCLPFLAITSRMGQKATLVMYGEAVGEPIPDSAEELLDLIDREAIDGPTRQRCRIFFSVDGMSVQVGMEIQGNEPIMTSCDESGGLFTESLREYLEMEDGE
jgi:hypothetical protein